MTHEVILGIDLGGTNTALGFVDQNGKCFESRSFPTNTHEPPERWVERLAAQIEEMRESLGSGWLMRGIGIGAPNGNYFHGTIENAPNLKWKGVVRLVDMIRQRYDIPVALTNDANAAALGEKQFGAAKGMKDFILITLGTGLGSGIVANGELLYGSTGFAGELGHTIVDSNGRQCGCGRKGCLETYVSAPGLCRTAREMLATSGAASSLRNIPSPELTAKIVADAAHAGDVIARDAFGFTGEILGRKLADAVAITSPEAIILFGGLALAGEMILEPTRRHLEENLLNIFRGSVSLLASELQESNAAVLGASALVWHEVAGNG